MVRIVVILAAVVGLGALVAVGSVVVRGILADREPVLSSAAATSSVEDGANPFQQSLPEQRSTEPLKDAQQSATGDSEPLGKVAALPAEAAPPDPNLPGATSSETSAAAKAEADLLAAADDSPPALRARIKSLLKTMTPAEQEEMARQLRDLEKKKAAEQAKYALPSQQKLQDLGSKNPAQKLTDYQQQQLSAINATMQPRIMAALTPLWNRDAQLRQTVRALDNSGQAGLADPLRQEIRDLGRQRDAAKNSLDKDYRQMLSGVLTPDQQQAAGLQGPANPKPANSKPGPTVKK